MENAVLERPRGPALPWSVATQATWLCVLFVIPPLVLVTVALLQTSVDATDLFRDPLTVADERYGLLQRGEAAGDAFCCETWLGALSNVGVLVWSGTAGGLLVGFVAASFRSPHAAAARRLVLAAFLLTSLLALDDLFQFHERFGGGLGAAVLVGGAGSCVLVYLVLWRTVWTRYVPVLMVAGGLLAASLAIDQVMEQTPEVILVEDVLKLFGVFLWAAYHLMLATEAAVGHDLFFQARREDGGGSGSRVP